MLYKKNVSSCSMNEESMCVLVISKLLYYILKTTQELFSDGERSDFS